MRLRVNYNTEMISKLFQNYIGCADIPNVVAQRHIFGGAHPAGYDPHIRTRPIFLYNAPTPSFIIICLLVRKLSCWQTNTPTYIQTTDAAENTQRSSLRYDVG